MPRKLTEDERDRLLLGNAIKTNTIFLLQMELLKVDRRFLTPPDIDEVIESLVGQQKRLVELQREVTGESEQEAQTVWERLNNDD